MRAIFNAVRFPFLFLYFVGRSMGAALGMKDPHVPALLFLLITVIVIGVGGHWLATGPKESFEDVDAGSQGLTFIASSTGASIIRITTLESALGQFHFRHGRSPEDFNELRRAELVAGWPEPSPGMEFQIDFETPAIIEVPVGTPPPQHPDKKEDE